MAYYLLQTNRKLLYTLLLFLILPRFSLADEWINPGEETLEFGLGVFLPSFDSSLQVDNSDLDLGTGVDLENDLGLDSNETVFWLSTQWRFSDNHRLGLSYFQFSRDSIATALTDIEVGEEIFPAGATLTSKFDYSSIPFIYSYSFIKSKHHELAGTFGLHLTTLELDIRGDAFVGGGGTVDGNVYAKAQGPLPLFGVKYDYYANKRWSSGIHGEVFALDLEDTDVGFSGVIYNVRASTEYWFYNHFGVGAALNWFSMDVDVKDSEWRGRVDYEYLGPQIYANMRF